MSDSFEEARRSLGDGPSDSKRAFQRARLLVGQTGRQSWLKPIAFGVGLTAVAAGVIALVVGGAQPALVRDAEGPIAIGAVVIAERLRQLDFSEGSQLTLSPGAAVRFDAIDASKVEVVLERGHLEAQVTKGTGRTWRYRAGPWTIRVVGTKLSIDWEPGREAIEVAVTEGAVEVSGPWGAPVLVSAGQHLERGSFEPPAASRVLSPEREPSDVPTRNVPPRSVRPAPREAPPPLPQAPAAAERLSWQQLLAQGRRPEALDEASAAGVFAASLGDEDALQLADAARLERRGDLARVLLAGVLERSGPNAAEAAFFLGRLEFDAHRPEAARRFFSRSVSLAPEGPFVEQARGRLLEALLELEELPAAREVARDYLVHHPGGAWERIAKQLRRSDPK